MPHYQQGLAAKSAGHEWFYLGVGGAVGLAALVAVAALLAVRKRRQYPSLLLPPKQVIAVRGGFPKGPGGLKQSPSPLQSPLSNDSTPSPIVPLQTLLEDRTRKLSPSELPSERGNISFTLSYDPHTLTLLVSIINCRNLCEMVVSRDGQCLLDPYVKLQLLPEREHRVKTRIVRSTTNPVYEEQFAMYGVTHEQVNFATLHFQVVAFDRYSRDTVVGECVYRLADAELQVHNEMRVELPLLPRATDTVAARGELLLSLTYQAAFNNLTVVVLKARGLGGRNDAGTADPFVKLYLRKESGERIVKKRTHVRRSTLNPVYNESFVFELPDDRLEHSVIDLQVINHDRVNRNDVIGRALLNMEDSHVVEVLENPGRQVAQWHHLD
ncbi:CBN-SNT-4 protein [Caenorhabditis brenneri]|uniref:CBN-SNT-4 protein n=1 Tax=Caenorhabditis brenneri TaxID=135651 RepID=G0NZ92_CAEBE|nr:CBN-SNT-4 protein [Caenorhabditis brenneri]